jgi:hypothetical protein
MLLESVDYPCECVGRIPAVVVGPPDESGCALAEPDVARPAHARLRPKTQHGNAILEPFDDRAEQVVGVLVDEDDARLPFPGLRCHRPEKALELDGPAERRNDKVELSAFRHEPRAQRVQRSPAR